MNMFKRMRRLATIAVAFGFTVSSKAEKIDMSPEKLRSTATHVVLGKVAAIYQRSKPIGNGTHTNYVAEVRVIECEKGCGNQDIKSGLPGLKRGDLIYVRYWRRRWTGEVRPPPSTAGHRGLPSGGDTCRIYLARGAYDGFTFENKDGGFNIIGANGFEELEPNPEDHR